MPMNMALWSARRMRRQAGADQRTRWNSALVPNMANMDRTYTVNAALLPASGPAAMRNGPPISQATNDAEDGATPGAAAGDPDCPPLHPVRPGPRRTSRTAPGWVIAAQLGPIGRPTPPHPG